MIQGKTWVEHFSLYGNQAGELNGLSFAVKNNIAVASHISGCGNPHWQAIQSPQTQHAAVVEKLLNAGAHCMGTTWMDGRICFWAQW